MDDVILDISDYIEPDTLKQRRKKIRVKMADDFRDVMHNEETYGGQNIEVILDDQPSPENQPILDNQPLSDNQPTSDDQSSSSDYQPTPDDQGVLNHEIHKGTNDTSDPNATSQKTGSIERSKTSHDMTAEENESSPFPTKEDAAWLNLDDERTFGEVEERDVLMTKKITSHDDINDDSRLFNVLLTQFRRNPALAGIDSIQLQLGQDQVVEPVAMRRLIAQVQNVLDVHEMYVHGSRPLVDDFFDDRYNCLSSLLFQPLLLDNKTIYASHVSAHVENDHTVRYQAKADMLNDLIENFKHPISHRGKKSYNTALLYRTIQKAYGPCDNDTFHRVETQTPIKHFIRRRDGSRYPGLTPIFSTEYNAQSCVATTRPESYLDMTSTFSAYRISENVDIAKLLDTNLKFAVEKRQVSYPVLQPQYDEDEDSILIKQIVKGENVSIIGFVVDWNRILDEKNVRYVGAEQDEIKRLVDSKTQFVVLCPSKLKQVLQILAPSPSVIFSKRKSDFRGCFNLEFANDVLSTYNLDISNIDRDTILNIRKQITWNIIDLIEYIVILRNKNRRGPVKHIQTKQLKFFRNMPNELQALVSSYYESMDNVDDLEFLSALRNIKGFEQLYCLTLGYQSIKDSEDTLHDIQNAEARLRHLPENLAVSFEDVLDFVQHSKKPTRAWRNIDGMRRHLQFLQDRSQDLIKLGDGGSQSALNECVKRIHFYQRREQRWARSMESANRLIDTKRILDFSLSLDEESGDSSENNYDSQYLTDYSSTVLPTHFLSPELRKKLMGDSSVDLQLHFTAKPLLLIARQINTMIHPNKLSCSVSLQEIKDMVYDISEMSDECFSFFERRRFVQQFVANGEGAKQADAVNEWKRLVGGELDVKSQKRVAVLLARLTLQLELRRPVHSFRKIFPIGGQKSIGKDSRSSFESYTPDNRFKYMVTVAAQTADLGKEGRLMNEYQASDLQNIQAYTVFFYDKFLSKPNLLALKAVAERTDEIQNILQKEKSRSQIPYGYDLVQSEELRKPLLDRLDTYDVTLQTFALRLSADDCNFAELESIQQAIRKKIHFLVVSVLARVQRQINEIEDFEWKSMTMSAYNPEKYGNDKSDACQPGQVCIFATFANFDKQLSSLNKDLIASEVILKQLRFRPHLMTFPRRNTPPTYNFINSPLSKSKVISYVLRKSLRPLQAVFSANENNQAMSNSVVDELIDMLATKTGKDEHWRIAFSAKLSNLGRLRTSTSTSGLSLLKQFSRSLRQFISLLSGELYVTVNSYEIIREKEHTKQDSPKTTSNNPGDTMDIVTARGTAFKMKKLAILDSRLYVDENRNEWDVLFYNQEDKFLARYLGLSQLLKMYKMTDALQIAGMRLTITHSSDSAREQMLLLLSNELLQLCNFVLQQDNDAVEVAEFCIDYLQICFQKQDDIDYNTITLHNIQNRAYEKYLKEIAVQSKDKSEEFWTFRKAGINLGYLDDVGEEDELTQENTNDILDATLNDIEYEESREDFDIIDDENKMNLFNDDE